MHLDPGLVETLRHVGHRHYGRLVIFLLLYLTAACTAVWTAQEFRGNAWVYAVNIPLYLLAAASLHGISLFTHEGVHGTLSLRPWWNRAGDKDINKPMPWIIIIFIFTPIAIGLTIFGWYAVKGDYDGEIKT